MLAGTSAEGIRDGGAHDAWFAQPSGLATSPTATTLWVADSETSALRHLHRRDGRRVARTRCSRTSAPGCSTSGTWTGRRPTRCCSTRSGVTVLPDGSVAVCDTYNGAVRRFDPASGEVTTLATGLAEPSAAVLEVSDGADPVLVVVESAAHRLTRVAVPADAQRVDGGARRTQRPPTDLAPGDGRAGRRASCRRPGRSWTTGGATRPSSTSVRRRRPLLAGATGRARGLTRTLRLADDVDEVVLHVSVQAAACDGDEVTGEVPDGAACHLYQQDWGIPVRVRAGAPSVLELHLRGT